MRGDPPTWLRRAAADARAVPIEIAGLSIGATHELLGSRLGVSFPRPTLIRLWEAAGGNPFFALELADALRRRGGTLELGEELPVPSSLADLLGERLRALGSGARAVAQVAAALAEPTADLVHAAVPTGDGLAEALEAQVLELDGDRIRFSHPLLASAALAAVTASQRGSLHARLAELVPTEEERARHLALATTSPSAEIAATLEAAARSARGRGAPSGAAELAEQALRLTPPGDPEAARRRLFLAADACHVAGDTDRAIDLLEDARALSPAGAQRAEVLVQLAAVSGGRWSREGTHARYVRTTFVPEDETCFHLIEAPSADVAAELCCRANLGQVRIVEANEAHAARPSR